MESHAAAWLAENESRALSPHTITGRRFVTSKLVWFLRGHDLPECDPEAIRAFFTHCLTGHALPGGRWGIGKGRDLTPMRPRTLHTYDIDLRSFFTYLVSDGVLSESPMERVSPPVYRPDEIRPFTDEELLALRRAARGGPYPDRDEAIFLFLLDTGCRAAEVCSILLRDVDMKGRQVRVLGKGNKHRSVYFVPETERALFKYLRRWEFEADDPLFLAEKGTRPGAGLTPSGLLRVVKRWGRDARITGARCSPHTFRHSYAVGFLRNGGDVFSLQQSLGHTDLAMTRRYASLAEADVEAQHRRCSPVATLGRNGKRA